jgi:hypothetical protein
VITEGIEKKNINYTLSNMKSCSKYYLQIHPSSVDGELDVKTQPAIFRTKSLFKDQKEVFSVKLNNLTDKVDLSWSKVECATGYKLEWRVGKENQTNVTFYNENQLGASLDSPEPCLTIRYY